MADEQLQEKIVELERELKECRAREEMLGDLLEKKLNEIYVHYHISKTIGSLYDLQEMLRQVVGLIKQSLPVEGTSVYLLDEHREKLELAYASGFDLPGPVTLKIGEGTPGRIVESGEHVHLHDLSLFYETFNDFIHYPGEPKRDGSFIGVTLRVHNATIGCIGLDNPKKYGLTVDDMDFMAILSHQIAAGIEKFRLFENIQRLSQHDGLTGLYNHRMFYEKLDREITRRGRNGQPLSLMMIDIDHFKRFNDTYGHPAGDAVLRELSGVISRQIRCHTIDICCRYGGEEFSVIMPEQELSLAARVAERLRKAVEEHLFPIPGGTGTNQVTVSIGVSGIAPNEDLSVEELIKKADDALYVSKRNGRNRVTCSPPAGN